MVKAVKAQGAKKVKAKTKDPVSVQEALGGYVYWDASQSILHIVSRLDTLSRKTEPLKLHKVFTKKIHQFELMLQDKNVRVEDILYAKYFICALIDETLEGHWLGEGGAWRAYALLFYFFKEQSADEKAFMLIDRLLQDPKINLALLEFAYLILVYGYRGHYRHKADGAFALLQKIDELYHAVHTHDHETRFRKSLFLHTV